jgi:chaperonin cofactor prefoldin
MIGIGIALAVFMARTMSRMESRLNQRMDRLETRLDQRMDQLEARLNQRMDQLETRMDQLEQRMAHLDGLLEGLREAMFHRVPPAIPAA